MITHKMRQAWRAMVSVLFAFAMICAVGFVYHKFVATPPSDNMKMILQTCGVALAFYGVMLFNTCRVRRREQSRKGNNP